MSQTFPTSFDYCIAVANGSSFILDPVLRKAKARLNRFNQPTFWAGAFALVFLMEDDAGHKHILRCWTADQGDMARHYAAVSATLSRLRLPCFVDFEYVPRGIVVNGATYPILRMGWVEGDSLAVFIAAHLDRPQVLQDAAASFLNLCETLHRHGLAHGDLESDNLKIRESGGRIEVVLLDYDTLFVPALDGTPANYAGLSAYQHPNRKEAAVMTERVDYFSELVIYLSLVALSEDPGLWDFNPETEHDLELLFTAGDFRPEGPSPLFKRLRQLSPFVSRLSLVLWNFVCRQDIQELIPLEQVVQICNEERPAGSARAPAANGKGFDALLQMKLTSDPATLSASVWLSEWPADSPTVVEIEAPREVSSAVEQTPLKVFISHASADRATIEQTILPLLTAHGVPYWYSTENIPSASDWEKVIRKALADCDWFLVALSDKAIRSDWVQAEVHWALDNRRDRFVSLKVTDCNPSDLHLKLIRYQHVDFRQPDDEANRRLLEVFGIAYEGTLSLSVEYRLGSANLHRVLVNETAFIGRANDSAILLNDPQISRRHGLLKVRNSDGKRTLWLSDLGGTNEIKVNGVGLRASRELSPGDVLSVGKFEILITAIGTSPT